MYYQKAKPCKNAFVVSIVPVDVLVPWGAKTWWAKSEPMREDVTRVMYSLTGSDHARPETGSESSWWRHQMETFSALLAICAGNSPVPAKFPAQRPVARSFDVFFDLRSNKRLSKHWWCWWFETPSSPLWRHCNTASGTCMIGMISWSLLILKKHLCFLGPLSLTLINFNLCMDK